MATDLSFSYDAVGDILYIQSCPPYAEQYAVLEGGVVIRQHPATREVERVELMGFSTRQAADLSVLPIPAAYKSLVLSLIATARAA